MQYLYKLKKSEYLEGFELAKGNSEKHFEASLLLAKQSLYPFAITHIILSAEELAKAIVLKVKSIDNNVKIPDLDKYFKSHDFKQENFLRYSQLIDKLSNSNKIENKIDEKGKVQFVILGILLLIGLYLQVKKNQSKTQEQLKLDESDSINSIEKLRLSSTYVEFLNCRKWRDPFSVINNETYEGINLLYIKIRQGIIEFIFEGALTKDNISEFIMEFKKLEKIDVI